MAYELNHLKNEINNIDRETLGLRNRKQKKMITYFFEKSKSKLELFDSSCSILENRNYQTPQAGSNISFAYCEEEINTENNQNLVQKAISIFSKEEQNFVKETVKTIGKNHIANTMMSCFNISPLTFCLGNFLFNIMRTNAQDYFVPPAGYNYTLVEGPWGDRLPKYNACAYDGSPRSNISYEFCNQFSIDDEYGDGWFGIDSYLGVDRYQWDMNPSVYCQEIFKQCRSVEKTWEPLKQILENNTAIQAMGYDDSYRWWYGVCTDQRNVERALCPSTTVFGSVYGEKCLQVRGCNSTTHTSSFSRCIDEALANLTGSSNTKINYILPRDSCILPPNPPSPYIPPDPFSSSTGTGDSSLSDLTSPSNSNYGWIAAPIIIGGLACFCLDRHIKRKNAEKARRKEFMKLNETLREAQKHLIGECNDICKLCTNIEYVSEILSNLNIGFSSPLVCQYAGFLTKNNTQFKVGKVDDVVINIQLTEMFEIKDEEDEKNITLETKLLSI